MIFAPRCLQQHLPAAGTRETIFAVQQTRRDGARFPIFLRCKQFDMLANTFASFTEV